MPKDPYRYLHYVLQHIADASTLEDIEALLPLEHEASMTRKCGQVGWNVGAYRTTNK